MWHPCYRAAGYLTVASTLTFSLSCRPREPDIQPARIMSGSMAERYWGEHWEVPCADCGFTFRCGVEHPPDRLLAVCPNCGFAENQLDWEQTQPGLPVNVLGRDFDSDPLRRWEIVAFHEPGKEGRVAVKRVVGLPGEKLAIRGGDIYINGARLRKSLGELRELQQFVHLARYAPSLTKGLPDRWQALHPNGMADPAWGDLSPWSYSPELDESPQDFSWLKYQHWRCGAIAGQRTKILPILDSHAYNQGLTRQLNAVRDIALRASVVMGDGAQLRIKLTGKPPVLVAELDAREDAVRFYANGEEVASAPTSTPLINNQFRLEVAICDGRLLAAIDGEEVVAHELGPQVPGRKLTIVIGARGGPVSAGKLEISRDVYHLHPSGRPVDWAMDAPLGQNQYFVLGDNAPNSVDSRHYGAIRRDSILGIVQPREGE